MAKTRIEEVHNLIESMLREGQGRFEYASALLFALHSDGEGEAELTLLPVLCCEAVGGNERQATAVAAAWHLLHLAAKILDDVEDEDADGALWSTIGSSQAINVATGFIFASQLALAHLPQMGADERLALSLCQDFNRACLRMCAGQHADLTEGSELSLERYFEVVAAKSGEFFALACRAGALLGGGNAEQVASYSEFGYNLGVLIQIWDDFEGIWNPQGKSDLATGKRTLPIIYALSVAPLAVQKQLMEFLSRAADEPQAEGEARRIITDLGAPQYVMTEAQIRRRRAERALLRAGKSCLVHQQLIGLLNRVMPAL